MPCDERFNKEHPSLKSYLQKVAGEQELHTVVMQVDKSILRYLEGQKYYNGFVSQQDIGERVEMTFLTSYLESFARWYIMFGDQADIVTPDALIKRIKELLCTISKKM
jgi:predicted DNA-binding transcriptional regulator YafY